VTPYRIRVAREHDLGVLRRWRSHPHVARWWGDPNLEPEHEKLQDPRIAMWIAELDGPFAFIQDYRVHAWPDHHFSYLPVRSRGMDVYIGEPTMIGLGHGSRLIRQHVDHLFASAIGVDPHPENHAAQKTFHKAGFSVRSGPLQTRWSLALLMDREAPLVDFGRKSD
jgi:aminoglycoside 6'-N-acetyltransferase